MKAALERNISGRRGHEDHVTTELYSVPFGAFDGCFVQLLEGVKICVAVMGEGGVGGGRGLSSYPICTCSCGLIPGTSLFDFVASVFIDSFLKLCSLH